MMFLGEIKKNVGLWTRKVIACFKKGLVGHPSRSLEDNSAERNLDHGGPDQEVLEGNNNGLDTFLSYFGKQCGWFLPLS